VVPTVSREEDQLDAVYSIQSTDTEAIGGTAEGSLYRFFAQVQEAWHLVESAAADNADSKCAHLILQRARGSWPTQAQLCMAV
jgi:hypothetical protein